MRHESDLNKKDQYVKDLMQAPDQEWGSLLALAHQEAEQLGKKRMSLTAVEGRLLKTIISLHACKNFVEVGALTGYSALWISQALGPKGKLYTLELDSTHAQAAKKVLSQLPQGHQAQVVEGDARETLKSLTTEGPFDGIFIDANKPAYGDYLTWADANLKPGGLIMADNIFLNGAVYDESVPTQFGDKQLNQMREFNKKLANEAHYTSCILPTPDGMFLAVKKSI